MSSFKALLSEQTDKKINTRIVSLEKPDLPKFAEGEVLIRSEYSSLNYKDALGVTGQGRIFKKFPMIGGIDVAGKVEESSSPLFKKGDAVLVTGCGLGEESYGGYSEYVSVPVTSVIPIPKGLSTEDVMIIGTAGFTAALCLWRFQKNDQVPSMGPILVTGASGGVGSFAVDLFSRQGFDVIALSGRKEHHTHLKKLGAKECLTPDELELGTRPLESVKFGGAVDNVGGEQLAAICRHVQLWGNIGSIGLAGGAEFSTTVMPHILRGVSILGISSNNCLDETRRLIWNNFAGKWKPKDFKPFHSGTISIEEILPTAQKMLDRKLSGRVIVKF